MLAVPDHEGRRRLARRIVARACRSAPPSAPRGGRARARRPRRRGAVDPALAERARAAAERLTGRPARVAAGRIELPFDDEHELEELAEALERLRRNARIAAALAIDAATLAARPRVARGDLADTARRLFLRMAAMLPQDGRRTFLDEVAFDDELDEDTKDTLEELATKPVLRPAVVED